MKAFLPILFLLAAIPSALMAQTRIYFMDGTAIEASVLSVDRRFVRIELPGDISRKIDVSHVDSICFQDGCLMPFRQGRLQMDRLVRPQHLVAAGKSLLLEGVYDLSIDETSRLLDAATYAEYRKHARFRDAGEITSFGGAILMLPYLSVAAGNLLLGQGKDPAAVFRSMGTGYKVLTIAGAGMCVAGLWMAVKGGKGCRRIAATCNDGIGLAVSF